MSPSALLPLRPYQRQALDETREWFKADPFNLRAAIVLPTGGGKTVVFAHRVKEFLDEHPEMRALVLVHTDELVRQAVKKILDVAPHLEVGVVKAKENDVRADVIVASVQTLRNPRRMAQIRDVGLVIVDECHHAVAKTYMSILDYFGAFTPRDGGKFACQVIGFTATLVRGDDLSLGTVWQEVTFSRSISWMVRKGYLIPPRGKSIRVPDLNLRNVKATKKDFREGELGDALVEAFAPEIVAQAYAEHAADRKGILFAPTVSSAQVFAEAFEDAGIKCEVVHGALSDDVREAILDRHRAGITQVIANCMVLTEGYDDPEVSCIVVARPTKSKGLYVQMVGRGLRVDQSKPYAGQDCLILDVVGAAATNDLRSILDLSEKPLDEKKEREGKTLTELEDEFDAGEGVPEDAPEFYHGEVSIEDFDPLGAKSRSKVWIRTSAGTYFVPAGKERYVFIFEYPKAGRWSVAWCTKQATGVFPYVCAPEIGGKCAHAGTCARRSVATTEHRDLDLETAMGWAEDLAQDLGAASLNTTGKEAPWRRKAPSAAMVGMAKNLGITVPEKRDPVSGIVIGYEVNAGKLSDQITRIMGSRRIDPLVRKVRGR